MHYNFVLVGLHIPIANEIRLT